MNESNRHKLAKSVAIAMNDPIFSEFVFNELNKNWGGDNQFLINDVFNRSVNENMKFKNYLENAGLDNSVKSELEVTRKIRILATEFTNKKITEQGIENLLVVEGEGEAKNKKFFYGYKLDGTKLKIDAATEPLNPVLVVNSCEVCTEEEAKKWKETINNNLIRPRRTSGYSENITYCRITNIGNVEAWNYGRPEVKVDAIGYSVPTSTAFSAYSGQLPHFTRGTWESGFELLQPPFTLFYWQYATSAGPYYIFKVWEWDDDGTALNIQILVPTGTGSNATFNLTGIKDGDEQIYTQAIFHQDPDPNIYSTYFVSSHCSFRIASLP